MEMQAYLPNRILRNGHSNTILSRILQKPPQLPYKRKRLQTPDDDFFDVDFLENKNNKIALLFHGLEGSSDARYIRSIAKLLHAQGWDIAAMNYRGRSGEINKQRRVYHAGATDDIGCLVNNVIDDYDEVVMVGYSFGGSLSLSYCGQQGASISPKIKTVIAISVPLDLGKCGKLLDTKKANFIYQKRFLRKLKNTVKAKEQQYPDFYNTQKLKQVKTLEDFDDAFTGPVNGFQDAQDYYKNCSCKPLLKNITIPALIINAQDDPFLIQEDYTETAFENEKLTIFSPKYGGHCGFSYLSDGSNWADRQVLRFIRVATNEEPA